MKIYPGVTFDTDYESGCRAIESPDENGNFRGFDSDGIECSFSVRMIPGYCKISNRTIAECNPPVEYPRTKPYCGICGRHLYQKGVKS